MFCVESMIVGATFGMSLDSGPSFLTAMQTPHSLSSLWRDTPPHQVLEDGTLCSYQFPLLQHTKHVFIFFNQSHSIKWNLSLVAATQWGSAVEWPLQQSKLKLYIPSKDGSWVEHSGNLLGDYVNSMNSSQRAQPRPHIYLGSDPARCQFLHWKYFWNSLTFTLPEGILLLSSTMEQQVLGYFVSLVVQLSQISGFH
jgi:hypothetical protein